MTYKLFLFLAAFLAANGIKAQDILHNQDTILIAAKWEAVYAFGFGQGFACGGKQTINIYNLNLEYWPQWFAIEGEGHYATEVVPGQWNGQVNYTMNRGGSSLPNVTDHFWADDSGHNFQSKNNLHKKICTSEERLSYYPNYGQEVFDITLNKWLICTDTAGKTWRDASGQTPPAQ